MNSASHTLSAVMRYRSAPLLLALVLSACDAVAPGPEADQVGSTSAAPFASVGLAADSSDFVVVFAPSVINPILASDQTFGGQDVRRRGYIQETQPAVAA